MQEIRGKDGKRVYIVRPIKNSDDEQMAAIIRRNFESYDLAIPGTAYFDPQLDNLAEYYYEQRNYEEDIKKAEYYVITDENEKVYGGGGLDEFRNIEGACELQKLYFDDSIKGRGLSRKFMSIIEEEAKSLGYDKMYIETHSKLATALVLYDKMGYQRIPKPDFVQHGAMDTFLIKKL